MSSTPSAMSALLTRAPVIPVLAIERLDQALPLAEALIDGGLPVLEITLRTSVALDAIRAITQARPDAWVGVGTYTQPAQAAQAQAAGAQFLVSPGLTDALVSAAAQAALPLLPGVATASDILRAQQAGFEQVKFFPAAVSGGIPALNAFAGPFPDMQFCPTGGVSPENYLDYLACRNVVCVGGTWLAPADAVAAGDWARIQGLAALVSGRRDAGVQGGTSVLSGAHKGFSVAGEEDPGSADETLR